MLDTSLVRLTLALALTAPLQAQFSDGFESYASGSAIEGQGGWQNWDSVVQGNQPYNTVVSAPPTPHGGDRMLRVVGSNDVNCSQCADTIHRLGGPYTSGQWTFRIWQYLPNSYFGEQYVMLLNDWTDGGVGPYEWSLVMHMDSGTSQVFVDILATANPTTTGGPQALLYDQWVEIRVELDLDVDACEVFYGGVSMYTYTWSVGATTGLPELEILDLFANETDSEVFYDDVSLTPGISGGAIGSGYCSPAVANSTGQPAVIQAFGSPFVLPQNQFGYFINSMSQGFIPGPGGSQGNLCVTGQIGRYNPASGFPVLNSGPGGSISLVLDLANTPQPNGPVAVLAGETWNFQAWYRDLNPTTTSNFTNAVSIAFQ
jgi:hypothetical protein